MTRGVKNTIKLEQISLRLPANLIRELDQLKEKEGIDRSVIIVRALKYWVSVGGNITTDSEFLTLLHELQSEITSLRSSLESVTTHYETESNTQREMLAEQQKTINTLLRMIPKE